MPIRFRNFLILFFVSTVIFGCVNRESGKQKLLEIHDIQGCGHQSLYDGQEVEGIKGVVTAKESNGFIIQSTHPDEQKCSSEALFIFTGDYSIVQIGDFVSVKGKVSEFFPGKPEDHNLSQTEIINPKIHVISSNQPAPDPILLGVGGVVLPPVDNQNIADKVNPAQNLSDTFESLEWMLVQIPESVVIGPRNIYNEIEVIENSTDVRKVLSIDGVLTNIKSREVSSPVMVQLPDDWKKQVNVGDVIQSVVGVMEYSYGSYKVILRADPNISKEQIESESDSKYQNIEGMRIVIYNIHNFSSQYSVKRLTNLAQQITKKLNSPDLIVLQEVEDDSGEVDDGQVSAQKNLALLVKEIKKRGGGIYQFYDLPVTNNSTGGVNGGNIRTVFLVRQESLLNLVQFLNPTDEKDTVLVDERGQKIFETNPMIIGANEEVFENSRKPIAGLFTYDGQKLIVIGVHLISHAADSPDLGNIQPPSHPDDEKRKQQAEYIVDWANQIQKEYPDILVVIAGDFNDMGESDTLNTFIKAGYVDPCNLLSPEERFSIVENGIGELFDHILVSDQNSSNIAACRVHHINTLYDEETAVSDHDPVEWVLFQK